jgi:predicted O-linked N-acetylglucosamine transferase (SPINDLY family)
MNFIERFADHQIGYIYQELANQLEANKDQLVNVVTPELLAQGKQALLAAVMSVLPKTGLLSSAAIRQIIADGIDSLDAEALAFLQANAGAFIERQIGALQAHAKEMLAA